MKCPKGSCLRNFSLRRTWDGTSLFLFAASCKNYFINQNSYFSTVRRRFCFSLWSPLILCLSVIFWQLPTYAYTYQSGDSLQKSKIFFQTKNLNKSRSKLSNATKEKGTDTGLHKRNGATIIKFIFNLHFQSLQINNPANRLPVQAAARDTDSSARVDRKVKHKSLCLLRFLVGKCESFHLYWQNMKNVSRGMISFHCVWIFTATFFWKFKGGFERIQQTNVMISKKRKSPSLLFQVASFFICFCSSLKDGSQLWFNHVMVMSCGSSLVSWEA